MISIKDRRQMIERTDLAVKIILFIPHSFQLIKMGLALVKDRGSLREKFFLPLGYLVGVQLVLLGEFARCLLFFDCFNSYFGLVSGTECTSLFFHSSEK